MGATAALLGLAMRPSHPEVFAQPKYAVTLVAGLGVAGAALAGWRPGAARHSGGRARVSFLDALAVFASLQIAAWALSIDRGTSLHGEPLQRQGLLTALSAVAACWFGHRRLDARGHSIVATWLSGLGVVVSAYLLIQASGHDPVWDSLLDGRPFSFVGQPNAAAAVLILCLPFAANPRWSGAIRALVSGFIVVGVLATESRGAYVALVVMAAATGALRIAARRRRVDRYRSAESSVSRRRLRIRPSKRSIGLASAAALAVGICVLAAPEPTQAVTDRAASIAAPLDVSNRDRVDLWIVGASISIERPILGAGQDTFPLLFWDHAVERLPEERMRWFLDFRPESPHMVPLQIASGSGLPSAGVYLALLWTTIWTLGRRLTERADPTDSAIFAALLGHQVTDMFITSELTGVSISWMLLGLGAARLAPAIDESERPSETTD